MPMTDHYRVSTDRRELDIDLIHDFLTHSYWSPGVPRETVKRCIRGSLCFGLFEGERQIGFARVITDQASFAYLADVFVLETHRGRGLSRKLMGAILAHPELQGLRRWLLATRDAHGLYAKLGFTPLAEPSRFMEINRPRIYLDKAP